MRRIPFAFPLSFFFFLSGMGVLLFFLPFSHILSSLFFSHLSMFSLIGLGLFLLGILFLLGVSSSYFQNTLTLKVSSSYEVNLQLIRDSLQRYLKQLYPEKKMEIEVFLARKKRLEIVFHFDLPSPLVREDDFLRELKVEVKNFLRERFDYNRTFFLTISSV